ncbi:MAG: 4-(cytidine 5'-diphospho)-2-C-methyl-D-erythritol kinase [Kiritimatiellae bacterium]|nr:4-(cytidine 5'-diphospho)-2-C-methyl-D-erythritol kinase [Kiritimatiellia bacterium]
MTVQAYAKVNLTLEVLGVRDDGYHALRSVVMPVSLADTLEVEATGDGEIAVDSGYADDLCVRAALALRTLCAARGVPGASRLGARISVAKRIPAGGGLGGGSADAAATLVALNGLWAAGLTRGELSDVGAQVGSDVPALAMGGTVVMEGRGETVSRMPCPAFALDLVLAGPPGTHSSTRQVYAAFEPRDAVRASATEAMVGALASGDLDAVAAAMSNDLQAAAMRLHPEIAAAADILRAAGAHGVTMSGSGSTVFGLVKSDAEGRAVAAKAEAEGLWAQRVSTVAARMAY